MNEPIAIDGALSARVGFLLFLFVLSAVLFAFSSFDWKLAQRQAEEVDRYMAGTVSNRLLHSPEDYAKASLSKSKYLLFKRTFLPFSFLLFSLLIFLCYIGGAFGFRMDGETSAEVVLSSEVPVARWWSATLLGIDPSAADTGWGFEFFAGVRGVLPFDGFTFYVLYTNLTAFASLLWIFLQLQGFAVRYLYTNKVKETSWNVPPEEGVRG